MSAFVLAAGPSALPPAADLHLLPFALAGAPSTAPTTAFFQPRAPPPHLGFPESTRVAAFRGRTVVGQRVEVPKGWRGVVLRAAAPPNTASGAGAVKTATASAGSSASPPQLEASASTGGRTTRARAKGAGQVALARPRRAGRREAKRVKIDMDDEAEEDESADVVAPLRREADTRSAPRPEDVPDIAIIPATQEPSGSSGGTKEEKKDEGEEIAREAPAALSVPTALPTPRTEREPAPADALETQQSNDVDVDVNDDGLTTTRVLTPAGSFTGFMLWTPDAPLAGFDAGELERKEGGDKDVETKLDADADTDVTPATDTDGTDAAPAPASRLEPSWWRRGGAGEGGDEFVRALGEWIGLGEIIHKRVYDGGEDDSDDDE